MAVHSQGLSSFLASYLSSFFLYKCIPFGMTLPASFLSIIISIQFLHYNKPILIPNVPSLLISLSPSTPDGYFPRTLSDYLDRLRKDIVANVEKTIIRIDLDKL